jgi:hypothetical protein
LEVLDAIKSTTHRHEEDSKVVIDDMEEKTDFKRHDEIGRSFTSKLSPSPESKSNVSSKNIVVVNTASNLEKKPTIKALNVIPIKPLNSHRETTNPLATFTQDIRTKTDRFSPKPKDVKINAMNVSPKQKIVPQTTKLNEKITFETKYSNKIYTNLTSNLVHKSPSPKPNENKQLKK